MVAGVINDLSGKAVVVVGGAECPSGQALAAAFTELSATVTVTSADEDLKSALASAGVDHDQVEGVAVCRETHDDSWAFVAALQQVRTLFGRYPRYHVGIAAGPADPGSVEDAVMETWARYLTADLMAEDVRVNVVRPPTDGEAVDAVSACVVALCGGLLDSVKGETITVTQSLNKAH